MESSERGRRLLRLFESCIDLPPAERDAFITRVADEDPALGAELRAHVEASERARTEDLALPPGAFHEGNPLPPGAEVGAYRIAEKVGEGGMGVVYRAEHREHGGRSVALKVVRLGRFASPEQRRRFLQEQHVLYRLEHPRIARVYDTGSTEEGVPYFAMEFVEGRPITAYADAHGLGVEARVRLFAEVCRTVHAAHQNLVIHRDLKPSNILVTEGGPDGKPSVKLLDFGIAKLLEDEDAAPRLTRTGERLLTPEYASPEQVRGEPVSTATDVYSLGVVLYELLAGALPYTFGERRSPSHIEQVIAEREPVRPSAAAKDAALSARLRGDLDTIVLKALRKEPERRYGSAAELADDLGRHLTHLPVTARPDTWSYRTRTFLRRHATAVAVAAGVLLLVVAVAALYTLRLRTERDRTQAALAQAERVAAFTVGLFEAADPYVVQDSVLTARAVLDRGAERARQELEAEPAVRAAMLETIATAQNTLGRYAEAVRLWEEALALRRGLGKEAAPDLARSLYGLGHARYMNGDYDPAEALMRESLDLRRRLFGEEHASVAESMDGLAAVLVEQGDYEEAERLYRAALDLRLRLFDEDHPDVARSQRELGNFLTFHLRKPEEGVPLLRTSLATLRAHLGPRHLEVGETMAELGLALRDLGRLAEAGPLFRSALDIYQDLLGPDHFETLAAQNNFGTFLVRSGRYTEAEATYRDILARLRRVEGDIPYGQAFATNNLAKALEGQKGRYEEALAARREALELARQAFGADHPRVAEFMHDLGALYAKAGEAAQAEAVFAEALAFRQRTLGEGDAGVAHTKRALADLARTAGNAARADSLYREALAALEDDHAYAAPALEGLGRLRRRQGKAGEADTLFRRALTLYRLHLPGGHEKIAALEQLLES